MSGKSNNDRFEIRNDRIVWYCPYQGKSHLTGVILSIEGSTFCGANSRRTYYGWCGDNFYSTKNFSDRSGLYIEHTTDTDKEATFDVDVNIGSPDNTGGNLGVGKTANIRTLEVWDGASFNSINVSGSKNRIIQTSFYIEEIGAIESPAPSFCDYGRAKTNEDGAVIIALDPRFQEVISKEIPCWYFQTKDGSSLGYENIAGGCIVKGNPNTEFNWFCISTQYDSAGYYAERHDGAMPTAADFLDFQDLKDEEFLAENENYGIIGVLESEE